jgi:hypothetical protein
MFVKCSCQNCGGHIEFDTSRLGQTVACPHCHLETKLVVPDAGSTLPNPSSPSIISENTNVELRHGAYALGIASLILGIVACVFYWTPFLEPFFLWIAILGLLLAVAGLIMARINKKTGFVFPIIGLIICAVPLTVDVAVIGGTAAMLKIANWRTQIASWRADRAAHEQELADAKAQMITYQHQLPIRANEQVQAYLLDLQNITDAELAVKPCETNVALEESALNDAQQQFNKTKAEYDQFVASNSLITNAAYLKLSHQLNSLLQQRTASQQSILSLQAEIAGQGRVVYGVGRGGDPTAASRYAQVQQDEAYLAAAKANLPILNQNITSVQQQLNNTTRLTMQFPSDFQENKLHDAESILDEATSHLTDAQSILAAAKQRVDEYKKRAESDLAAVQSVLEEERGTTFSIVK